MLSVIGLTSAFGALSQLTLMYVKLIPGPALEK